MRDKHAWKTENWLRVGGEVLMVQQRWTLHREKETRPAREGYAAISQTAFPTDEWRLVNLKEMLTDDDLNTLLEARNKVMGDE